MTDSNIHMPEMIHKDLLYEHPQNSNKQNKHVFKEVCKSIRENGFDENLIVAPRNDDIEGYFIISGNHRYRAGVHEGMVEFPCVVRKDWDEIQQQIELVRRNYVRGNINREDFTMAVSTLADDKGLAVDEIRDMMGFKDAEEFFKLYKEEEEQINEAMSQLPEENRNSAAAIEMVDDLGMVLGAIFEQYGDTVPNSFIVFPAGGKKHFFVAANSAIVKHIQEISEYAVMNHMDVNVVLGGILAIGKHHSHLGKEDCKKVEIKNEGEKEDGPDSF